jgi:hypothetical protein
MTDKPKKAPIKPKTKGDSKAANDLEFQLGFLVGKMASAYLKSKNLIVVPAPNFDEAETVVGDQVDPDTARGIGQNIEAQNAPGALPSPTAPPAAVQAPSPGSADVVADSVTNQPAPDVAAGVEPDADNGFPNVPGNEPDEDDGLPITLDKKTGQYYRK